MSQFLSSLGFILFWLVWILMSPFVFVAMLVGCGCHACHKDWKPWVELR